MKRTITVLFCLLLTAVLVLSACAPAATEAPAAEAPAAEAPVEEAAPAEEEAPAEEAPAPAEEAPAEEAAAGPQVGGTYVLTSQEQPDTLDIQKSGFAITSGVMGWIGGSLLAKDMEGNYIPYLAESWEVSEDGKTYTFHLREIGRAHV
jgi:peptide/nickel transport system substrate-binding protein